MHSKITIVNLSGGIIGALTINPKAALQAKAVELNADGYRIHQITPHANQNLLMRMLQLIVLVCTAFLWTWGAGYLILSEKHPGK